MRAWLSSLSFPKKIDKKKKKRGDLLEDEKKDPPDWRRFWIRKDAEIIYDEDAD